MILSWEIKRKLDLFFVNLKLMKCIQKGTLKELNLLNRPIIKTYFAQSVKVGQMEAHTETKKAPIYLDTYT